jgi:hypothetical protein
MNPPFGGADRNRGKKILQSQLSKRIIVVAFCTVPSILLSTLILDAGGKNTDSTQLAGHDF